MSAARSRACAALREGVAAVVGAVDFVRSLPPDLPKAVASSSSTRWVRAHLAHLGLADAFGDHIYSGREHVERGKPAPDLYLHAARRARRGIERTVILEDSEIGVTGALASGATVIGLAAGRALLRRPRRHGCARSAWSISPTASTRSRRLIGLD